MGKSLQGLNLLALLPLISGQILIADTVLAEQDAEAAIAPLSQPNIETDGALAGAEQPTTVAQSEPSPVEITGIRVEYTEAGLQVVIEADGALASPTQSVSGNALVLDIPSATLAEAFQAFEPADGIALIQASALPGDIVQVAITGSDAVPVVDINTEATGLVLAITPGVAQAGTDDDAIQLVVTGEDDDYVVPNATTATRTDTPLIEVPQSIQVIPQAVLEDQQVIRLNDALRNAPGVIQGNTFGGGRDNFTIRGFEQSTTFRDGFRIGTAGIIDGFRETSNVAQVEVLRGPAAILYGNVEPGGVINLVTEQPQATFSGEVTAQIGSYGLFRPTFDITGPANEAGTVRYRLNTAYEQSDGFRDFGTNVERVFVSPVVAIDLGDRTELTLELEYLDDERPFDRGIPPLGNTIPDVPRDTIVGEPADFVNVETLGVGYRLQHRFNDDWQLRNRFRYGSTAFSSLRTEPFGNVATDGTLNRVYIANDSQLDTYEFQTEIQGEFSTGSINHTLLAGVDIFVADSQVKTTTNFALPVNLFDPQIGIAPTPTLPLPFLRNDSTANLSRVGLLLQDQIELLPGLNLLLGGRVDFFDQRGTAAAILIPPFINTPAQTGEQSETAFTPRVGIVYQPIEALALYASYSQSFQPNTLSATTVNGEFLEPERGEQFEVGVKANLLEGRLAATLSFFDISQTNVAATDPANANFVVPIGRQSSQGIELDITGEILPGWNVLAGFSLLDAVIEESSAFPNGAGVRNVPDTAANLWTTYEIQEGDLAGLGFGLGLYYVGARPGDGANTFTLDDYLRTDAAVYYRQDDFRLGLNVRNLFDVTYFESGVDRRGAVPGDPFTVIGSISINF